MKNLIIIASVLFAVVSCEKKVDQTIDTSTQDSASLDSSQPIESSTVQNCYLGITGKDSVYVSIDDNLGTFTGKMRYKNFEKDSSNGDLMGTKNGDTLKLNYTFASEGMNSDREIYFLLKDGKLIEGIGEHKVEGNKDMYANPAQIKYTGQELEKAECKNFEKNFTSK